MLLLPRLGEHGSVRAAAVINFAVGTIVLIHYLRPATRRMTYPALLGVVALAGFIPLSYEILWFRAFSFIRWCRGVRPVALLLSVGLAIGAFASRLFCRERATVDRRNLVPLATFVYVANLLGFLVLPALAWLATTVHAMAAMPLVAVAAGLWERCCHSSVTSASHRTHSPDPGSPTCICANIIGSAADTLTGFGTVRPMDDRNYRALRRLARPRTCDHHPRLLCWPQSLGRCGIALIAATAIGYTIAAPSLF